VTLVAAGVANPLNLPIHLGGQLVKNKLPPRKLAPIAKAKAGNIDTPNTYTIKYLYHPKIKQHVLFCHFYVYCFYGSVFGLCPPSISAT
jgi:hypothetical protein